MNVSEKYEEIIIKAGLACPGLSKGTLFIYPKGWYIWEFIQKSINAEYKFLGIKNVSFPSFIPYSEMNKEKNSLKEFNPELFFVSKSEDVGPPSIFLRPTSEILFSHYFKKNLHSYNQLPILLNQWCNVYRSEKNTKSFLRSCEFHWQEAHTIHETKEDAYFYLNRFHEVYKKVIGELLCLDFLEGEKTINERFPGSNKTLTIEVVMPDGQCLQVATSHYLSTNFSSMFEIKYSDRNNKLANPHQLSAGSSTRLLGAIVLGHSDEKGLILPFLVSDIQIKILVIDEVVKKGDNINRIINEEIQEYSFDWEFSSKKSFGFRMSDAEFSGIPVVVVVGKKELSENMVMVKSRVSVNKEWVNVNNLKKYMHCLFKSYSLELKSKSSEKLKSLIVDLSEGASLDRVKFEVLQNGKVVLVPWWDNLENEKKFKKESLGFGPRCIKSKISNLNSVRCFYSGKLANSYVYFGRSY